MVASFGSKLLQDAGYTQAAIGLYGAGLFFCGLIYGENI